ncbi:hypothetical protein C0995_005598 [Termitomyces sp. Mi166|nr:hypothetical protein C0995_005598 [Termitomyces sp. Mi166\
MASRNRTILPTTAFTLYLAYKAPTIGLPPPGTTRTQAEVLQIVCDMWLNETSHVRARFEKQAAMQNEGNVYMPVVYMKMIR